MKLTKKQLTLGTLAAVTAIAIPVATVVSCGKTNQKAATSNTGDNSTKANNKNVVSKTTKIKAAKSNKQNFEKVIKELENQNQILEAKKKMIDLKNEDMIKSMERFITKAGKHMSAYIKKYDSPSGEAKRQMKEMTKEWMDSRKAFISTQKNLAKEIQGIEKNDNELAEAREALFFVSKFFYETIVKNEKNASKDLIPNKDKINVTPFMETLHILTSDNFKNIERTAKAKADFLKKYPCNIKYTNLLFDYLSATSRKFEGQVKMNQVFVMDGDYEFVFNKVSTFNELEVELNKQLDASFTLQKEINENIKKINSLK